MEINEGLMEQPDLVQASESELAEIAGSSYGKFKDATSMYEAYKNLEAEFTRKSQRVSALEKQLEESSKSVASKESDALIESEEKDSSENATMITTDEWKEKVDEFFASNPDAKKYKSRMSRILHENPEYLASSKSLEIAYKLASTEGLKLPADLLKDQNFIEEYVLTDSRIKDIIITDYIQSLSRGGLPKVISGNSVVQMATPRPDAPKSVKEAGMLARKFLG